MTLYKELSFDGEECVSRIKGIQFCIMGPEEIRKRSVAEITKTDTYAINEPVQNGLFDSRMGVIDNNKTCKTCEQRNTFCPGHFGHIELARPLFYVQFFGIVQKLLRCVCFRCSKLLVDLQDPSVAALLAKKHSRQKRWEHMHKLCSNVKRCGKETLDGCGARQPDRVTKTDAMKILMEWKDLVENEETQEMAIRRQVFGADDVLRILRRITDEDSDAMGFCPKYNRPEWMICVVLPVPPPCVRPSVRNDTGVRKEDDLTHKLGDIIKFNNTVKSKIEKGASYDTIEWHIAALQQHVATLIDNTGAYVSKDRTGRIFRTICDRLNRKEGRIRGNLMGKRVDFSARTVITPDPNISIDELGVPMRIAMNLTFPEVVNQFNIEHMYRLVRNGPELYPGAKHIRKGSRTIRLKGNDREAIVLEYGDIVERHLCNGDYVLFNRQPSLHKMSMMAHRVRVMAHNTFRLNVCVCASYNADFDGDEMNMHVPQSLQSHEEIVQLAAVPLHIISPRHSKPIISIVQDIALGVFRITQEHIAISKKQLFNLVCSNPVFTGQLPPPALDGQRWTGRQLLSTIIPPTTMLSINYKNDLKPDEVYSESNHHVHISCGQLQTGVLAVKAFNDPARGLIRNIINDGGPDMVAMFLNNTQKLICDWLVQSGFSVGISDLLAPSYKRERIKQQVGEMHDGVSAKIAAVHAGEMKNVSTMNNRAFFESQIEMVTRTCIGAVDKVAFADIDVRNNRMLNMIKSGSKGQPPNFIQMLGCLGQQIIDNQRIPDGFDHRTLPHFTKYDDGAHSRGFVEHSFVEGLTPQEFFFHSMAGRVGLIDTAVRSVTWETRVLVLEDGRSKEVRIGEWIDEHLKRAQMTGKEVQLYPEDRNLELLELDAEVFIPTVDDDGRVTWGRMTAVTRHDPGDRLYKVKTRGGREVTVAESKSLLVWQPDTCKFLPVDSREVKVGDCLPVVARLGAPPAEHVISSIDMTEYFPKDEYVHGTEYLKAADAIKTAQGDKYHIPRGWMEQNNGTTFTVPYSTKARFQRACFSGRSEVEHIKAGFIYPFHANREVGIKDKFELDWDNGAFIGMFLADGHTSLTAGQVGISKTDLAVQEWIKTWFERHGMATNLVTNTNERGTSQTMFGYSTLLARFLDAFVGTGAHGKHIPAVAFTAPVEFVRGLLSGYFSGDGCVERGALAASSVSRRLIEGIALLCSRLGAFGKLSTLVAENHLRDIIVPDHRLKVRAQWGKLLADELNLILPAKRDALDNMTFSSVHRNYAEQEDVVLDPIESIEVIGIEGHPKLYDVTVPSTLNFVLFNGLGCRDTSETGYIQRKLVTFMQDLKVHADLSVRNSAGQIIQFLYGEDGIDATKVEYQILPYIEADVATMRADHLLLNMAELSAYVDEAVMKQELNKERMVTFFEHLTQDREFAILVKKGRIDNQVQHPVNISIMVMRAAAVLQAHGSSGPSDLHPEHVLDVIDELITDLTCTPMGKCSKFMAMLLRCHLSPKQLILKRFTRAVFDVVVKQIRTRFFESMAHPGEMVGILAAQSIGEPTTQTTLNTFHLAGWGGPSITTQQGVPRLQELFHVSKSIKTPYMRIFVREPWNTDMNRCRDVCSAVQTTRFSDVVQESKVYYDPPGKESSNIHEDQDLIRAFKRYTLNVDQQCRHESQWVLRFEFDRTKMLELQISMLDLEMVLRDFYDDTIVCMFSDDNAAHLVARVRLNNKDIDTNDMLTELRALEENILSNVVIKGVKHIEKAVPLKPSEELMYDPMTSTFVKRSEWAVETSGTNLMEVLALPHVDPVRTYTNDINEINRVLGIEAARQQLYNELHAVMWQKDTNAVDFRHMALLVDAMTSRGFLTSVNRHGINKGDIGPLAKCSFEQTTEMLIHAGVFAEVDRINGVAANIMLGQVAPCGTGDSEILIDDAALQIQGHEVPIPSATRPSATQNSGAQQAQPSTPQLPNYRLSDAPDGGAVEVIGKIEAADIEIV